MMAVEHFLDGRVTLHPGDCLDVLPLLSECSLDSCVTDAPYHLTSTNRGSTPGSVAASKDVFARVKSGGFMGKKWDGGDIAFRPEIWAQVNRVLKPGAYLVAFGGTRTYHRMACAIEDAGFEIRDTIMWVYGSGFPKSLDVSKAIDKAAGAQGEFGERKPSVHSRGDHILNEGWRRPWMDDPEAVNNSGREYLAATDAARQWSGFGTALKPACEPIVLARKPLEGTVAQNVLKWGTGALNIDGCRVEHQTVNGGNLADNPHLRSAHKSHAHFMANDGGDRDDYKPSQQGRWPANVIHDGSEEVVGAFPDVGVSSGGKGEASQRTALAGHVYGEYSGATLGRNAGGLGDSGSAARFFYTAKADSDDRLGSKHPTVKPLDLMQYLVRLVTPPKGLVLDPFAGTGTTGEAAWREGMRAILIEREAEYQNDIRRRMALALGGPEERRHASLKARGKVESAGPLFDDYNPADDVTKSFEEAYRAVRERVAAGGPGWKPKVRVGQ